MTTQRPATTQMTQSKIDFSTRETQLGIAKSYDQWKSEGRFVRKGERSRTRCPITEKALFFKNQTESKAEQEAEDTAMYRMLNLAPSHSQDDE
jgi:hypothetical protein